MKYYHSCFLICFVIVLSYSVTYGQNNVETDFKRVESVPQGKARLKKADQSGWYDYKKACEAFGYTFTHIKNSTVFPDSMVYQGYFDTLDNEVLGKTSFHSVGQVFDPKDDVFTNPSNISWFNPYVLDSISFRYRYAHNIPGTVDTLLMQFYNDDKIKIYQFSSGRFTSTIDYDKINNRGYATSEVKILLTGANVSNWSDTTDYRTITVAVPAGGLNVIEGKLTAASLSFIPGYSYNNGDTIVHDWNPEPSKKLNHFIIGRFDDESQIVKRFPNYLNCGLLANSTSRYTNGGWDSLYYPGQAWVGFDMHFDFQFHLEAYRVSIEELSKEVKIYPNPSINTPTIIQGAPEGTVLHILDLMGREIVEPMVLSDYDEINLHRGTYFLRFDSNGQFFTKKLVKY